MRDFAGERDWGSPFHFFLVSFALFSPFDHVVLPVHFLPSLVYARCLCPCTSAPVPLPLPLCPCTSAPVPLPLRLCPCASAPAPLPLCLCPCASGPVPLPRTCVGLLMRRGMLFLLLMLPPSIEPGGRARLWKSRRFVCFRKWRRRRRRFPGSVRPRSGMCGTCGGSEHEE